MKPGSVIESRFEILSRVSKSGASSVFFGRDLESGDPVAVKMLNDHEADDGRFDREVALLTEFSHPSIVRYIAHGTTAQRRYLVMEWVEGETLSQRLAKGFTIREGVEVTRRIAEALINVHHRGVVHRDIKPSNIMFPDGRIDRVKLVDFGIARRVGQPSSMTRTGSIIGTPGYMSPEQVRGEWEVDARTDVFSLGCVLYGCICGSPAFAATHMLATLTAILFFDPTPVDLLCPEAPASVSDLVGRMVAKDPDMRPSSAAEVATELAEIEELPKTERKPFRISTITSRGGSQPAAGTHTITTQPDSENELSLSGQQASVFVLAAIDKDYPEAEGSRKGRRADNALAQLVRPARDKVAEHDGMSALLADGTFVAMFPGGSSRAEQTASAASCALFLRQLVPQAPMVIGLGECAPANSVLDRLVETLIEESFRGILDDVQEISDAKPIRLGNRLSEFLDGEFAIQKGTTADYLLPVDRRSDERSHT